VSEVTFDDQRWFELDPEKVVVKLEVNNPQASTRLDGRYLGWNATAARPFTPPALTVLVKRRCVSRR